MSTTTTNFGIVLPEGSDTFNPLTFNNDAFTLIDGQMKTNQDAAFTSATHTLIDGINTILRAKGSCNAIVFVASADYNPSNTIAVDGVTCTLRYADGSAPQAGAFKTNQAVICYLNGTILTLVSAKAGVDPATVGDLDDLETSEKASIVAAINENAEAVADISKYTRVNWAAATSENITATKEYAITQHSMASITLTVPYNGSHARVFTYVNGKNFGNIGLMKSTENQMVDITIPHLSAGDTLRVTLLGTYTTNVCTVNMFPYEA